MRQWNSLSLEENQGFLSHYVVKITKGCLSTSETINITTNSITLTNLVIGNEYCVSVASATKKGVGVFSKQKIIPCKLKLTHHKLFLSLVYENSPITICLSELNDCSYWTVS